MKKSGWLIIFSTLIFCSEATSHIPYAIEQELHSIFRPYNQVEILPSIQPLVESKIRNSTYSVEYDRRTAEKNISLDNAILEFKVYYNGNPQGVVTVATDEQQRFLFANVDNKVKLEDRSLVVFELLSINGQNRSNSKCYGSSYPGHPNVVIYCK